MAKVGEELAKLKSYWHGRIGGLTVETPDAELNSTLNMWGPFNCLMTYAWSRAASLIYAGERDGLGFRDTVQDMLGVMHAIPEEAGRRLELMITGQVSTGGAMPVVRQFAHHPGSEKAPSEEEYRSDDCLWLFNAIPSYVKETGDLSFYNKVLPYADKGEDTVLGHMKRAIQFNLERSGAHGLPCGFSADWNDCIRLGQKGETIFVAFQLRYALAVYLEICQLIIAEEEASGPPPSYAKLDGRIEKDAWDGEWYLRAYRDDGFKFGSKESSEGKIFLNPQSWAVISGHANADRARTSDAVRARATGYGVRPDDLRPALYRDGFSRDARRALQRWLKENASIFTHTQGWAVIAETLLGHGDLAYEYFRNYLPAAYNSRAEIRRD